MNTEPSKSVIINAGTWLRRMRLPYYALAKFRKMKLNDEFRLVDFEGPHIWAVGQAAEKLVDLYGSWTEHLDESEFTVSVPGMAFARLERCRGFFRLEATWTVAIGSNAGRRDHIWEEVMEFKLLQDRRLEIFAQRKYAGVCDPLKQVRLTTTVCRRAHALAEWAYKSGDTQAGSAMSPQWFEDRTRFLGGDLNERYLRPAARDQEAGAIDWLSRQEIAKAMHQTLDSTAGLVVDAAPALRRAAV